jgi:hypothetical protein
MMHRVPITLSVLILVGLGAASWFLISSDLGLTKAQLVERLIQLAATAGAFISATFVVWSYLQTNQAFALSQKPALLLFVTNQKVPRSLTNQEVVHVTLIGYHNTTGNSFYDLTIRPAVTIANRTVDLNDLFTPRMYMAGRDQRQRQFVTMDELGSRGLDLNGMTERGNEAILSLSYVFTFLGRSETVRVQEYKWERDKQVWSVR